MDLEIKKNIELINYSTFKIGGLAKYFVVVKNEDEFINSIKWAKRRSKKIFILGGGSNILFSDKGFDGLVIKNEIKGMEVVGEGDDFAIVKSYGGEAWSKLVNFAISHNYYGIENMFYIFGTVGAAPVQNIGAYGMELKDVFYNLCAIDLKTGEKKYFNLKDCQFGYRDSVFKNKLNSILENSKLNSEVPTDRAVIKAFQEIAGVNFSSRRVSNNQSNNQSKSGDNLDDKDQQTIDTASAMFD